MQFKLYDCDVGATIRGVDYTWTHVNSFVTEDARRVRLTRGANAGNKEGIVYEEGVKDAEVVTVTLPDLDSAMFNLLMDVFNKKERIDVWAIQRSDGSSKTAKRAVISAKPQQLTLDDTPDSFDVALILESFDTTEVRKS